MLRIDARAEAAHVVVSAVEQGRGFWGGVGGEVGRWGMGWLEAVGVRGSAVGRGTSFRCHTPVGTVPVLFLHEKQQQGQRSLLV